jgi:hydroxyethylthiazole kinase-like sugar kinase family protein
VERFVADHPVSSRVVKQQQLARFDSVMLAVTGRLDLLVPNQRKFVGRNEIEACETVTCVLAVSAPTHPRDW